MLLRIQDKSLYLYIVLNEMFWSNIADFRIHLILIHKYE